MRCPEQCTAESRKASVNRQLAARGIPTFATGAPAEVLAQDGARPRCGNHPAARLTDGDRAAVADFREHLRARAREDQDHGDARQLVHADAPAEPTPAPARTTRSKPSRAAARTRTTAPERPALVAAVAVDIEGGRVVADADAVTAPAGDTLADLFAWIGSGLPVGVPRLHQDDRDADGTVCLSAAVCAAWKIPAKLPTAKGMERVAAKLRKAAGACGMEVSDTIGAGFKAWRRKGADGGPQVSVKVLVVPWLGQGDASAQASGQLVTALAAGPEGEPDARTLARRLRRFAVELGVTPGATTAVTSLHLLEAVRPRFTWKLDEATGRRTKVFRADSLPDGDTAVPVAAGARHPLTRERTAARLPLCEEEDFKWWARQPSPEEAARPWAVALDVCASYLSVPETLRLPAGPLEHTDAPAFDPKTAGLWLCDFTGLDVEDVLPHPATFHGQAPTGPGWYATVTVDYMAREYGFDVATIGEAYVSTHTAAILREWLARVRGAYKGAMGTLGLVDGMDDAAFLAAWSSRKDTAGSVDRADALALVDAYKAVYKGGVGKWADSARHLDDDAWAERVAASWHYRPEIRFHIIAAARIAAHRRMRKTLRLTGRAPLAVNVDQVMYAADAPSPLELLPRGEDGRPVPGTLRLGSAPGSFKHDSSVPMRDVVAALADQTHPSRLTHDYTPAGEPVTEEEN
jgi:hypothetical protein